MLALLAGLTACAKVTIMKVGDPTGPEGLRFYMPRPYVFVHEPFVVSSEAFIVNGQMSVDGQYVLITDANANAQLDQVLIARGTGGIPASTVIATPRQDGAFGPQSEQEGTEPPPAPPPTVPTDNDDQENEQDEEDENDQSDAQRNGILNISVTNDNNAYAVTPLKRYMDVVWLPDFTEQYVVQGRAGFGNASIGMEMGQGWSLQGLDAAVDNDSVVSSLLRFYDQTINSLSTVVQTKLGVSSLAMGGDGGPQATSELTAASFGPGTPLSIKVTVARMAAPGLYPILKESEFGQVAQARTLAGNGTMLIPIPPLTRIAFNTYEVVVIEAATASGDSPARLHQYPGDSNPTTGGNPPADRSTAGDPPTRLMALESGLQVELNEGSTQGNSWTVSLRLGADNQTVTANLTRTGMPAMSESDAKNAITEQVVRVGGFTLNGDISVTNQ